MAINELKTIFIFDTDKADKQIESARRSVISLDDDFNKLGKKSDFAKTITTDFKALENKSNDLRKSFQSITAQRLDSGNNGLFTREIVKASEQARQLNSDIKSIKSELANPNRKSSIKFLTEELRGAEKEADSLSRKLNSLGGDSGSGGFTKRFGNQNRLSSFQKQNLSYQVNDVLTGLASGQNPTQILAQQSGQIAQIFSPAQITAFAAAYSGLVTILGAGAVAIAATYKITGDIRKEAERRLKVEEMIAGAINRQVLSSQKAFEDFKKLREQSEKDRRFSEFSQSGSLDDLKNRRKSLEQIQNLMPKTLPVVVNGKTESKLNEDFQRLSSQIIVLDAQIEAAQQNSFKRANDSFNKQFENRVKSQAQDLEFEKKQEEKRIEAEKKRLEQIEKAKDKLNDFRSSFASLSGQDNPLVKLMSDFETAAERAEKQFGSFGKKVVEQIASIERANLQKTINLQTFQNNLEALNFTQQAQSLRAAPENQFAPFQRNLETVERKVDSLSKIFGLNRQIDEAGYYASGFNPNNPKSFNEANRRGPLDDFSDTGARIRNTVSDILGLKNLDIGSTGIYGKEAVADKILDSIPSRDELLSRLRDPRTSGDAQFLLNQQYSALQVKREAERQKLNDFLDNQKFLEFGKQFASEKIGLINQSNLTDDQKALQRLSVTNALGNDLDLNLRRQKAEDSVAAARAKQKESDDAKKIAEDTRDAVQAIVRQLAEKGIKIDGGIDVKLKNETNGAASATVSPTASDTASQYGGNLNFGSGGGFSNR